MDLQKQTPQASLVLGVTRRQSPTRSYKRNWLLMKAKDKFSGTVDVPKSKKSASSFKLTHPEKILYPKEGITKADLARYYAQVAPYMLSYIKNRPLMILRCPEGVTKECFYQKHHTQGMPSGIESPDQLVFDLDPDPRVKWEQVVDTAKDFKKMLECYGLKSFVKTTGGKGLHVVTHLKLGLTWALAKQLAKALCQELETKNPKLLLVKMSKSERKGKIFLDYLRNGRRATAVAPYSLRTKNAAAAAFPIAWTELGKGVRSDSFHIGDAERRLKKSDPWADFENVKQFPKRV